MCEYNGRLGREDSRVYYSRTNLNLHRLLIHTFPVSWPHAPEHVLRAPNDALYDRRNIHCVCVGGGHCNLLPHILARVGDYLRRLHHFLRPLVVLGHFT